MFAVDGITISTFTDRLSKAELISTVKSSLQQSLAKPLASSGRPHRCTWVSDKLGRILQIFHFIALLIYTFSLYLEFMHFAQFHYEGTPFKFATVWYNVHCVLYHLTCFASMSLQRRKRSDPLHATITEGIRKLASRFFASVILPQAPIISFVFWTVYILDRDGAVPAQVRADPYWLPCTHIQHTLIVLTLIADFWVSRHNRIYPHKTGPGIKTLLCFSVPYNAFLTFRGLLYGDWTYSFLKGIPLPYIIIFYITGNCLLSLMYLIGHYAHYHITASESFQRFTLSEDWCQGRCRCNSECDKNSSKAK